MKLVQNWSDPTGNAPAQLSDIGAVFAKIVSVVIGLAAITLFFLLISGGYKLITAGGDPGKVQGAWKTITFAVLGFVLILASFLILRFIHEFTGVDVTQFKINVI